MQTYQPATLASLAAEGRRVWAYCRECQHNAFLYPRVLGLPLDEPVPGLSRLMKCSNCGSKKIYTTPDFFNHTAPTGDR